MGGEFQSEGVEALSEIANVLEEMVVGDQRGDGGEEAGSSGDESFGDARRDGAKAGGTGAAQAGESVDNAPDRAEQTDEGGDAGGGSKPRHTFLDAADFFGGGELHADGNGLKGFDSGMGVIAFAGDLTLEFAITSGVDVGERRAGGNDALRVGDAFGGAEDPKELVRLAADAAENAEFLKDQCPGYKGEKEQKCENGARDQASLLEDIKDVADDDGG